MKEKEYFKLLKEAEDRYRRDIDSIKQVWRLANGGPPPMSRVQKTSAPMPHVTLLPNKGTQELGTKVASKSVNVAALVTEIVAKLDATFTIHDIAKNLRESYPDVKFNMLYLSSVLMRMRTRGVIELHKERAGSEAASYIRANTPLKELL